MGRVGKCFQLLDGVGSKSQEVSNIDWKEQKGEKWREKFRRELRVGKEDVENEEDQGGGTDDEAEGMNEEDQGGGTDNAVEWKHEEDRDEEGKGDGREGNGEDGVEEVVREVHTVEADRLLGQRVGYPTTH